MPSATGRSSLLEDLRVVFASHLCSVPPMIPDLVLTRSDLLPWPALWGWLSESGRSPPPPAPSDLQVVSGATYTCFSWCAVHLAARQDLQFHPSQGAERELEVGVQRERLLFACAFLFCGSYGINYHLMATPGPRPFACLSCEKDLEEPTYGFDCRNCRLIE